MREADLLFEMMMDIDDFKRAASDDHRKKRRDRIFKHFTKDVIVLEELEEVRKLCASDIVVAARPPVNFFAPVEGIAKRILEEKYLPMFKRSMAFVKLRVLIAGTMDESDSR